LKDELAAFLFVKDLIFVKLVTDIEPKFGNPAPIATIGNFLCKLKTFRPCFQTLLTTGLPSEAVNDVETALSAANTMQS